jgi:prepilin-type N-terminal cleavage/methylation domain-containing protein
MKKMNKKGLTLIELIIVIVVIGILAGMAAPRFMGVVRDAKHARIVNDLDVLTTAAMLIETERDAQDATQGAFGADAVIADYANVGGVDYTAAETAIDAFTGYTAADFATLDEADFSPRLSKSPELAKYAVSTVDGTIVYLPGSVDGDDTTWYGLEIK